LIEKMKKKLDGVEFAFDADFLGSENENETKLIRLVKKVLYF
jgi:hypothetical protein